jgi:hypothetical protein
MGMGADGVLDRIPTFVFLGGCWCWRILALAVCLLCRQCLEGFTTHVRMNDMMLSMYERFCAVLNVVSSMGIPMILMPLQGPIHLHNGHVVQFDKV